MKTSNLFLIIALALCSCLNVFPQAKSLTVDNQTPGWLSSKINYGDQLSVERLKVTGYINGTDYKFLSQLVTNNLKALDLEEVRIVEGGEPIYTIQYTNGTIGNYDIQADKFPQYEDKCNFKQLKWLATPKSAELLLSRMDNDTLIANSITEVIGEKYPFKIYDGTNRTPKFYENKYLVIGEGIKKVIFSHNTGGNDDTHYYFLKGTIILPSSIEYIEGLNMVGGTLISYINNPEAVQFKYTKDFCKKYCKIRPGVLWVPEGTRQLYLDSEIFNSAVNIYEMAPPERIELDNYLVKLYKDESALLQVFLTPQNAFYNELVWNTSDETIASVSQSGEVKAVNAGTAIVTVSSVKNPDVKAECTVEVYEHVTGISMSMTEKTLDVDEVFKLSANTLPQGITDNEIEWSSSNPAIATVDAVGNVKAIQVGNCVIKATSVDGGYTAECNITVYQSAKSISVDKDAASIIVGNTEQLSATIKPDDTTDKTVLWSSSNTNVAEVDANGLVTAKKAGECTITATAASNPNLKATCKVTVIQPVTGIKLSHENYQLTNIGMSLYLEATVQPDDATNKQVKWRSTNENICTVSQNGYVVAVGFGSSTIIATSEDGNYSATCLITVMKPSYTITYIVDDAVYKSYEIKVGEGITPETAPQKEGYTFSGWSDIPSTMPAHDVTVTGTFIVNRYILTYLVDGETYKTSTVEYGTALTAEKNPVKEGYTFSGWSGLPETMPAKDVTVTGTFTINSYTLLYMVDGKEYKTTSVKYGTALKVEAEPEKEGYTFSGWSDIPSTMPSHDVTVMGTFIVNSYILTYLVDGDEYKTISVKYGSAITPEPTPTKEGYTFSGWSDLPTTMPAHDVTVNGYFSRGEYKLTYMIDGEVYKIIRYNYESPITAEPLPEKEGYTFSGWSEIPASMPAHDVTVMGSFSVNSYILRYLVDGKEYKSSSVKYGTALTPEAAPTKEGYIFSGWSEIPATMPAHDVAVTGSFFKGQYMVTYVVDGEVYKVIGYVFETDITPEPIPTKEGYTFSGWSDIPSTMPSHDVTVIGTFTVNSYILTYLIDGEEYKTSSVNYGTILIHEAEPEKEGHTFSGWSEIPSTMPSHDVTVTGSFSVNSYTIIYMIDGMEYKSFKVKFGETITPEEEPAKEGNNFSGWSNIPTTMPAHDVTVTGSFSKGEYRIIYIVDGEVYKVVFYDYEASIIAEAIPTKEGYSFSGWSDIPATMPSHDMTITGSFSINSYGLTYMVDGKEYKTSSVVYGTTLTAEDYPTKEGHTFSGWSGLPSTMPAYDVIVTGYFTINSYILTYLVDGKEYKTSSVKFGSALSPEATPTKEGYTFSGWSEIPATMPAHDVTITGSFIVNTYHLAYMIDGKEYKLLNVEYGTTLTAEAAPEKEGYTFSGWSEIPATMPAHDVTILGTFMVNSYTITYMVEGKVYSTKTIEFAATITPPEVPERDGYTFGWSEVPETMPAHDVTVTGWFVINTYTLLYMVDGEEYRRASVEYGTELMAEENPEKEGYSFSGWSEVPVTMPAHDVTVTGVFQVNQYSITYMYEGEVFQTVTLDYQAEVEAPAFPLVVEGYTFVWEGLPERMPAHDVTVTGVFQVNQYCITYVVDGEVVDTQMVDYGSVITPPEMDDREGYTFGWEAYPQTMPARDLTITGSYLTGIRSLKGGLAVQQIYTVDGKRVNRVGRGVHLVRQGKQIIKIVK